MSDFPAVPLVLERKTLGHVHVVIGTLQSHIEFLAEMLSPGQPVRKIHMEQLIDTPVIEALQTDVPTIFTMDRGAGLSLAADTRSKCGVWVAAPLRRRTAAIRVLVRFAQVILECKELDSERLDVIGDAVLDSLGEEAMPQALVWEAMWHLTSANAGAPPAAWKHPWEDAWEWARGDFPLTQRLQVLYKDLVCYVFGLDNDWKCAQQLGIAPSRFAWLKTLHLEPPRVERAIMVLSRWRIRPDPALALQVALQIGSIFAK